MLDELLQSTSVFERDEDPHLILRDRPVDRGGDAAAQADALEAVHGAMSRLVMEPDRPYGEEALALYESLGDRVSQSRALNNLAVLYLETRQLAQAEKAHRQGLTIRDQLVRTHPGVAIYQDKLAASHNNLSLVYRELGRYDQAEVALHDALAIWDVLAFSDEELLPDEDAPGQPRPEEYREAVPVPALLALLADPDASPRLLEKQLQENGVGAKRIDHVGLRHFQNLRVGITRARQRHRGIPAGELMMVVARRCQQRQAKRIARGTGAHDVFPNTPRHELFAGFAKMPAVLRFVWIVPAAPAS